MSKTNTENQDDIDDIAANAEDLKSRVEKMEVRLGCKMYAIRFILADFTISPLMPAGEIKHQ